MTETEGHKTTVERRRPDWWALESAVTERRDIVDELSDATGYFHDSDAAKLRDIASASGMRPVGIVRAAVEREIENREWRCVHFDESEDRDYPSKVAFEYYRIHRAFELEYNAAIEALPKEENARLREVQVLEHAAEKLEEEARRHRAKREKAESFLTEHDHELPDVEDPRPDADEPELVTDGGTEETGTDRRMRVTGAKRRISGRCEFCESEVVELTHKTKIGHYGARYRHCSLHCAARMARSFNRETDHAERCSNA